MLYSLQSSHYFKGPQDILGKYLVPPTFTGEEIVKRTITCPRIHINQFEKADSKTGYQSSNTDFPPSCYSIHTYCDTHRHIVYIYVLKRDLFLLSSEIMKNASRRMEEYHTLGLKRLLFSSFPG